MGAGNPKGVVITHATLLVCITGLQRCNATGFVLRVCMGGAGNPKGVVITHATLLSCITGLQCHRVCA